MAQPVPGQGYRYRCCLVCYRWVFTETVSAAERAGLSGTL